MKLFDVYPIYNLNISRANGCWVYDEKGTQYLDFYGGHAVISIGHRHPHYVEALQRQIDQIGFYSNSVRNQRQEELAQDLGDLTGLHHFQLFLVNSGAEANENAIKLASFHQGRKKIISFRNGFHGRTSAAVNVTDNNKIIAPINRGFTNIKIPLEDKEAVREELAQGDVAAIIIEAVQGVAGIYAASAEFLRFLRTETQKHDTLLILDEVQAGYGRTGQFFAFQLAGIEPDLITMAKGMGNGFPMGGVLIHPQIKPSYGLLGTTFGGNHLACAAGKAVLEVIRQEKLVENAQILGNYLKKELSGMETIQEVRGRGLMLGIELPFPVKDLRKKLLFEHKVFLGSAANAQTLRILPPLNVSRAEVDICLAALREVLH